MAQRENTIIKIQEKTEIKKNQEMIQLAKDKPLEQSPLYLDQVQDKVWICQITFSIKQVLSSF